MKKVLFALSMVITLGLTAQEAPKVTSAIIALRGNELVEAKGFIDEATDIIAGKNQAEIKEKILSKFYYNKSLIYAKIAASPDAETKALAADANDANDIAARSLLDLIQFEASSKKQLFTEKALPEVDMVAQNYVIKAYDEIDEENYKVAYQLFTKAFDLKRNILFGDFSSFDTIILYNSAYCAFAADDLEVSSILNEQLLNIDYRGISFTATSTITGEPIQFATKKQMQETIAKELAINPVIGENQQPQIYLTLLNQLKLLGKSEEYTRYLNLARSKFPNNIEILNTELQQYLDNDDLSGVLGLLDDAIKKYPENALYRRVKGDKLMEDGRFDESRSAYDAALLIDSNYFDVLFNYGVLFIDKAETYVELMNNTPPSQQTMR